MNNKKLGTSFEQIVCVMLGNNGYWVHFITPDARGAQPFDIIAVKDGTAYAIECKTLAGNKKYFNIDRLEDNQIMAFEKWLACGNIEPQICVWYNGNIYFIGYNELKAKQKIRMEELHGININDIRVS